MLRPLFLTVLRALLGAGFLTTVAGCAPTFPENLPRMMGYHPNPYSLAFMAAATEAFVEARTGRNMYALLDDRPYSLGGNEICTQEEMEAFLVRQVSRCNVVEPSSTADCTDAVQCMRFRISPVVMADSRLMAAVEGALRQPCAHITDWRTVRWPDIPTSLGIAPKHSARLLQCDGRTVVGTSVTRSEDGQYFIVHFDRAGRTSTETVQRP